MTPKPTEPTIEPELTLDQELRFNILVPFYGAMERKRQEDAGKLTKQDASPIYTEAIKKIERIISDQVAKAYDRGYADKAIKADEELLDQVAEAVEQTFIPLSQLYDQYSDECFHLGINDSPQAFFRSEKVKEYLSTTLNGVKNK